MQSASMLSVRTLFLIYSNDLSNISNKLKLFLFAVDTNIYHEDDNLRSLEKTSNNELKKLNQWLCVNRLALSISKTNFVLFHAFNKPIKENLTLKINHIAIKEQKYIKYLGVLLVSTFSWNFHIDDLTKKITRSIGVMYKIRPYMYQKRFY